MRPPAALVPLRVIDGLAACGDDGPPARSAGAVRAWQIDQRDSTRYGTTFQRDGLAILAADRAVCP